MKNEDLFSDTPKEYGALVVVAFGVIVLIGAFRRWKWVLQMQGTRPFGFLYWMGYLWGDNGYRVGVIILSSLIILCGIVFFCLMQ